MQTARDAVGPDVELMVDAGGSEQFWPHGYKWALETAKMLADFDVVWFEEALPPDDIEGFIKLTEHAPVPISTGEVLTRRQSFIPWIERRAVDIIQPDCTKVGGLSESRRIAWLAYDHNVTFVPHGWNTAVGLAADLHLVAALPGGALRGVPDALAVHRGDRRDAVHAGRGRHAPDPDRRPASAWTSTGTASTGSHAAPVDAPYGCARSWLRRLRNDLAERTPDGTVDPAKHR